MVLNLGRDGDIDDLEDSRRELERHLVPLKEDKSFLFTLLALAGFQVTFVFLARARAEGYLGRTALRLCLYLFKMGKADGYCPWVPPPRSMAWATDIKKQMKVEETYLRLALDSIITAVQRCTVASSNHFKTTLRLEKYTETVCRLGLEG